MKSYTITALLVFISIVEAFAVPAYPGPIKYIQPDGSEITIQLKGDERVHWAETSDGYTLLSNGKNGWEYAVADRSGDIKASGVLAREASKRTIKEAQLIRKLSKKLRFSSKQVNMLKSVWEAKNGSEELIGTGQFFKKNQTNPTNNDGRQKVFTPTGVKKLIMILIEYTDVKFTKTKQDFVDLMNTQNYNLNGAEGSVKDYFYEMSYGKFTVNTDVAPRIYTANHDMAYYGAPNGSAHDIRANDLMKEAVEKADPDVDFSQYDNDGDGSVDGVYIIYAGYGEATSGLVNTIWPHAGGITGETFDGKTISKYSCSNELNPNGTLTTIGVICHEFGHVCGAPDYYDTDYATGGQFTGTSHWDLMDVGLYNSTISNSGSKPAHFNPFEKVRAGWVLPSTITSSTSLIIPDITTNPVVYIYNTATSDEYYMLENRQRTGFNAACPGHGLMIYHYSKTYWDANRNKTAPQGFYPVCASATTNPTASSDATSYGNIYSAGCPFPGSSGKTAFYDASIPSSKSWAGDNTGFPLTNITENANGTISLNATKLISCSSAPTTQASALTVTPATYNTMNLSWVRGNGSKVIVLAREGSAVDFDPLSGTAYIANSNFKSGDEVGSGNYVVYNETGTSVSLTGLDGGTTYYFSVYEYNDADKCYSTSALTGNGTTNCTIDPTIFVENFERSSFGCWTATDNTGQGNWQLGTTSNVNYTPALAGNYAYFKCEYNIDHSYNADLISPIFDLSSYNNVVLKFKHLFDASSYYSSVGTVSYSIDNGATWTQLATYTSDSPSNPEIVAIPVNAAIGKSQVIFKWNYTCSPTGAYMWAIDDIQVVDNSNFWTGAVNTDWFTAGNWSTGAIPIATTSVVIPSALSNQPQIDASGAACMNITINNGASLTMNGTYTLSVAGDWTNNGTFTAGAGTVNFNGTGDLQTIKGSSTTNFNILSVTKGAASKILEVAAQITTVTSVQVTSGTFKLNNSTSVVNLVSGLQITSTKGVWLNTGTINLLGTIYAWGGNLRVSGGVLNTGTKTIYYTSGGSIIVEGGQINATAIQPYTTDTSIGIYNQSGGVVTVTVPTSSTDRAPFDITSGSTFTIRGGVICIQKGSSFTYEFKNLSTTNNVTGGTLQIGNSSTTANQTIRINSTAPIYNLLINGTNSPTANLMSNLTVKNNIDIQTGGKLQVAPAKALTANGTFTNNAGNAGFVLLSDATGTATFVDNTTTPNMTVAATVQQYLPSVRNWYMSTPVAGAAAPAGYTYYKYVEALNNGSTWTPVTSGTTFANMTGYIVKPDAATTFTFSGTLNTGAQSITSLTSTATALKGYNLVGNPYPSYVNWSLALANPNTANILSTMWYRTKNTSGTYIFDTFNGVGTNNNGSGAVTGMIPPMQAFWVKVNSGTTGKLTFDNTMRLHRDVASNNFRAPAANTIQQVLRLQVSNGTNSDEAIVLFNTNASDSFDNYDSPKMSNGNASIPEIYTLVGTEKVVINGLNSIATNKTIPLGFSTGAANTFNIKATEVTNFDTDTQIILKDNVLKVEQDITDGTPYNFISEAVATDNRFELIFKTNAAIDDIKNHTKDELFIISKNANNQLIITTNVENSLSTLSITNAMGQKLYSEKINSKSTVIDKSFETGVYLVTLTGGRKTITRKVIVN